MNAREAAKVGLRSVLQSLTIGGSPAFAAVFAGLPAPGQAEVRPRAAIVCRDMRFTATRQENWERDGAWAYMRTHEVIGSLSVLVAASGTIIGETGETRAEACVSAIEQAFQEGPADLLDTGTGTHGIAVEVADYPGTRFLYRLESTADAALELAERGIADAVVTVSVRGYAVLRVPVGEIESIVLGTTIHGRVETRTI